MVDATRVETGDKTYANFIKGVNLCVNYQLFLEAFPYSTTPADRLLFLITYIGTNFGFIDELESYNKEKAVFSEDFINEIKAARFVANAIRIAYTLHVKYEDFSLERNLFESFENIAIFENEDVFDCFQNKEYLVDALGKAIAYVIPNITEESKATVENFLIAASFLKNINNLKDTDLSIIAIFSLLRTKRYIDIFVSYLDAKKVLLNQDKVNIINTALALLPVKSAKPILGKPQVFAAFQRWKANFTFLVETTHLLLSDSASPINYIFTELLRIEPDLSTNLNTARSRLALLAKYFPHSKVIQEFNLANQKVQEQKKYWVIKIHDLNKKHELGLNENFISLQVERIISLLKILKDTNESKIVEEVIYTISMVFDEIIRSSQIKRPISELRLRFEILDLLRKVNHELIDDFIYENLLLSQYVSFIVHPIFNIVFERNLNSTELKRVLSADLKSFILERNICVSLILNEDYPALTEFLESRSIQDYYKIIISKFNLYFFKSNSNSEIITRNSFIEIVYFLSRFCEYHFSLITTSSKLKKGHILRNPLDVKVIRYMNLVRELAGLFDKDFYSLLLEIRNTYFFYKKLLTLSKVKKKKRFLDREQIRSLVNKLIMNQIDYFDEFLKLFLRGKFENSGFFKSRNILQNSEYLTQDRIPDSFLDEKFTIFEQLET